MYTDETGCPVRSMHCTPCGKAVAVPHHCPHTMSDVDAVVANLRTYGVVRCPDQWTKEIRPVLRVIFGQNSYLSYTVYEHDRRKTRVWALRSHVEKDMPELP